MGAAEDAPQAAERDADGRPIGAFDGGADPNPGPGGWGVVLPDGRELCGGAARTTNNRMELTAAIRLLEATSGPLHLIGDSHYVIAGITRWIHRWRRSGWRTVGGRPVENRDLWERLHALAAGRDLAWERVRGHSGHPLNERCDRLCAIGRRRVRRAPESR
ncbi:MAG: ribonuclease HI [Candidatus Eisenbacteria bacterium]|nr:ribonuclease HI [Candidatus Eisenbacteria bacterium]